MKKILRYFILTIMTVCFSVPAFSSAEAATVALLPLVNNVKGDELAGQIFYQEAIGTLNDYPEYMMIENDKLTAAIEKAHITDVTDEAVLRAIAKDGDVDVVIAMQLDALDDSIIDSSEERTLKLDLKGYAVVYNRLNDSFYKHRIYSDKTIPEALTSRWDWVHEEWGRAVRVEIDRALKTE